MSKAEKFEGLESAVEAILNTEDEVIEEISDGIAKSQVKKVRRMSEVKT